jgi:glutathione S-transferase
MLNFTLTIGNKAYSSWSLRGWLACKIAGIPFVENVVPLDTPETRARILAISPSGKVPCLQHDTRAVWESLAIGDYLAELFPDRPFWPNDLDARAQARSIAAEMHAGFAELRRSMPMNVRRSFPGKGRTPGALADIARITSLWRETRQRFGAGGPFLFGRDFSMADAMYAPVASRFMTWEPELPDDATDYVAAVMGHDWLREWIADAERESWINAKYETA